MTLKELAPGTKVFHFFFGNSDLYEFSGSWGGGGGGASYVSSLSVQFLSISYSFRQKSCQIIGFRP